MKNQVNMMTSTLKPLTKKVVKETSQWEYEPPTARTASRELALVMQKYSRLLWKVAGAVLSSVGSSQNIEKCVVDAFIYLWQHRYGRGSILAA